MLYMLPNFEKKEKQPKPRIKFADKANLSVKAPGSAGGPQAATTSGTRPPPKLVASSSRR
jgi:hypothetical protein